MRPSIVSIMRALARRRMTAEVRSQMPNSSNCVPLAAAGAAVSAAGAFVAGAAEARRTCGGNRCGDRVDVRLERIRAEAFCIVLPLELRHVREQIAPRIDEVELSLQHRDAGFAIGPQRPGSRGRRRIFSDAICACSSARCSSRRRRVLVSDSGACRSADSRAAPASLLSNSALARAISKAIAITLSAVWRLA